MTVVAIITLPVLYTGREIARWEGLLFVGYYVAYTVYLVLDATDSVAFDAYRVITLGIIVPITLVALAAHAGRALWSESRRGARVRI